MQAVLLQSPFGVIDETDSKGPRILSFNNWLKTIGGMSQHYKFKANGEIVVIDHARYDRDRPPAIDCDEIGRKRIWLNFAAILALGAADDGITASDIKRLFAYSIDADAALTDLEQFCRAMKAAKLQLDRWAGVD